MEQERFDQLARGLAAGRSRRGIVRNLAGAALGGVLAAVGASETGAKRRRTQHGKSSNQQAGDKGEHRKEKHPCPDGQTRCKVGGRKHGKPKKACVDLKADPKHCGECATVCAADELCLGGVCKQCTPQCQGLECGDDGCAGNCGTCASGTQCQQGHCVSDSCPGGCGAHGVCQGGNCVCDAGFKTCQTDPCATDITSDPNNCGACGNLCQSGNCEQGQCGCAAGLTNCNGQCIPTANDPTNCGACGNVCPGNGPHGQATCSNSACGLTCDAGYTDCGDKCADLTGSDYCGACGAVCSYPCGCATSVDGVSFCTHGGYCGGCTHDADCAVPGDSTVYYCVDVGTDICGLGSTTVCWSPC